MDKELFVGMFEECINYYREEDGTVREAKGDKDGALWWYDAGSKYPTEILNTVISDKKII